MKVISQETFDLVVLENVTEFGNNIEEAVEEAVKDFEAQGIHLSNIVKNHKLSADKKIIHELVESLNVLSSGLPTLTPEEALVQLKIVQEQCQLSLAHRTLGNKHGAYDVLLNFIKSSKDNPELLSAGLEALSALTDTNPDILTPDGICFMIELLSACQANLQDPAVHENLAKWCAECCLKHENNRQRLVDMRIPDHLVQLLKDDRSDKKCVRSICKALRTFTLDDDIRTPFGKAHDHARMLVEEHKMIGLCLELVQGFMSEKDVTSEILATLSRLCVRSEYCQEALDKGALAIMNDILVSFPDNATLNRQSINLLQTISGNDKVKTEVMKIGAGQLIVAALVKHKNSAPVCEAGCAAVSMLALRAPEHARELISVGAADAVVQVMKIHAQQKKIQKLGCMAVRNLTALVPENRAALLECQVETVIHSALSSFESDLNFRDIAKGALRDLDLNVDLQEQWRGTGAEIERGS